MPRHHIDQQMLTEYATGTLARPIAMLVATHIALCPDCRRHVDALEAIGGALLEQIPPAELADGSFDAMMARLDETYETPPDPIHVSNRSLVAAVDALPEPLQAAIIQSPTRLRWRRRGIGLQEIVLPSSTPKMRASLMKISAGAAMPAHTHGGAELTLVLAGGFSDTAGHYQRGDVTLADSSTNHRPIADADGECLCFAVVDGGIRLSGAFGRIASLMLRL